MERITDTLHTVSAPQRFMGIELGARMTVLTLKGGVLVHSPVAVDPQSIAHLGPLRWALAPNLLHHLHIGPWIEAGAEGWAAPGLPAKREDLTFTGVIGEDPHPFGDEVHVMAIKCFPFANEVVLLHKPSRTLVLTDLLFNIQPSAPWLTRAAMFCAMAYPGYKTSILERTKMKRKIARGELAEILSWDFDRVILSHGAIIETGGREALAQAYHWLKIERAS